MCKPTPTNLYFLPIFYHDKNIKPRASGFVSHFWAQTTCDLTGLSPKRDFSPKRASKQLLRISGCNPFLDQGIKTYIHAGLSALHAAAFTLHYSHPQLSAQRASPPNRSACGERESGNRLASPGAPEAIHLGRLCGPPRTWTPLHQTARGLTLGRRSQ